MATTDCPDCHRDVGWVAIVKGRGVGNFTCPHCLAALRYRPFPWLVFTLLAGAFVVLLVLLVPALTLATDGLGALAPLVRLLLILLLWVPFAFVLVAHVRRRCRLLLRQRKPVLR